MRKYFSHLSLGRKLALITIQINGVALLLACVVFGLHEQTVFQSYVTIAGLLLLVCSVVTLLLTARLQKIITAPILELAHIASTVASAEDYSVRADKCGNDEIGQLIDRFNEMLNQIQRREAKRNGSCLDLAHQLEARNSELAGSRSLLNATFESTTDGIVVIDFAGRIVAYNSRFAAIWQFPSGLLERSDAAEAQAYTDGKVKDPEKFHLDATGAQTTPETGSVDVIELKDGRTFERYVFLQQTAGRSVGTVIHWRDVSEGKKAEDALASERDLLRTLLDNSPDAIYFKDTQSRFIKSSQAQAAHFGMKSADELVGKTDFDFFTEAHAQRAVEGEKKIMQTGEPITALISRDVRKDGREIWILTDKMPLRNKASEVIGTFGISRDITAIKQAEAKLEEAHKQLIDASRRAGMAEVATGVLHNVGNVLNSVNVSVTLIAESVRRSKAVNLARVCALLDEHKADLGTFLTADPKGKVIPVYLSSLAESLAADRTTVMSELDDLCKNIDHIKEIVAMQQNCAKNSGYAETVSLPELVEDSLRMNADSLTRHDVKLVRDYQVKPVVTLDKHKVIQILINLIRNAKYACDESGRSDKLITMRITASELVVRIAVIDNGVGIPPENLTRIFNHGFTTRANGHGFGLHSGANAAKELGGSLTVQSEGVGHGATFILDLPLQSADSHPRPPGL